MHFRILLQLMWDDFILHISLWQVMSDVSQSKIRSQMHAEKS